MIQDIYPHVLHNHYDPSRKASSDSIVLSFHENDVLIKGETFPCVKDFADINTEDLIYLFSVDDDKHYFLSRENYEVLPEGYGYINVRTLRNSGLKEKYIAFVCYTAVQLARWYGNNKHCGRCGALTHIDDNERAIRCGCGNVIYPKIAPAVIVGVTNGDKLLVTKYRTGFAHFALVAGFTEIGETLEETVAREVMEETGLRVTNIRYYKSQPWGIVDDLLAGFFCDVEGDDTITMDEGELKIAEWRTREEIELQPDQYSLTNEMMTMFKEGKI